MAFQDRQDAGRQLAIRLTPFRETQPLVIALPPGGVIVGHEIARGLNAPLDVMVVKTLGDTTHPDLGVVAPNGVRILDRERIDLFNITPEQIDQYTGRALSEIERQTARFREFKPMPDVRNRVVILVEDVLYQPMQSFAAVRALKKLGPARVVVAAPIALTDVVETLRPEVDDLFVLEQTEDYGQVQNAFRYFKEVNDHDIIALLKQPYGSAT